MQLGKKVLNKETQGTHNPRCSKCREQKKNVPSLNHSNSKVDQGNLFVWDTWHFKHEENIKKLRTDGSLALQ